ncbi:alpha/beta hydrolase [Eubacteriaceae bacterium ES3]|nr:alpha/beta hydrolase [Eubacteriaceae bacterium ES3]
MKKMLKVMLVVLYSLLLMMLTYLGDFYRADLNAVQALTSDKTVKVEETPDSFIFIPLETNLSTGFIFYPGGKVEPEAYAPLMRSLAEKGVVTVIAKMPFNLAVFNQEAANKVMAEEDLSTIESWYIGGHSLGGSMASDFAVSNPDLVKGVVLMGAYPNKSPEDTGLFYLAITGSEDRIINRQSFESASWADTTQFENISGGNHSYFGDYGLQEGDSEGTISRTEQQSITDFLIDSFIKEAK